MRRQRGEDEEAEAGDASTGRVPAVCLEHCQGEGAHRQGHPGCRRRRWHGSGVGARRPVCAFAGGGVRDVQPRHAVRPWRELPVHPAANALCGEGLGEGKACDVPEGPLEHLWHLKDEEWRTHHHLICQAYTGNLAHHGLFAEVMLRSPAVNTNIPYSITQIFKILVDTGHKAWYSCQHLQWIITGDSAMDSLKSCIQIIAQRDLGHYHTTWTTESNEVRVSTP